MTDTHTDFSPLTCTVDQGLAHLCFTNPQGGNVMDMRLINAFKQCVQSLDKSAVRVVLITAQGKNFCVGGDVRSIEGAADRGAVLHAMAGGLHEGIKALEALNVVVVTAVNGAAAGAGLSLAVAGDIVLGSANSSYFMAYSAIGLSPDGGASYYLPRLIGLRLTQEMAFCNRKLNAVEAQAAGLITRVVADDDLAQEALSIARSIAQGPSVAYGHLKQLLGQSYGASLDRQLDAEEAAICDAAAAQDGGEGARAFLEKRKAVFEGR